MKLGVGQILLEIGARADELVPFDTGTLSRSQTTDVETIGRQIVGEIAYGGPAAPYALVQHEDLTLAHPPKSKGGSPVAPGQGRGPKYLEFPSREVGKRADLAVWTIEKPAELAYWGGYNPLNTVVRDGVTVDLAALSQAA